MSGARTPSGYGLQSGVVSVGLLLLTMGFNQNVFSEVIGERTRSFIVKFADGGSERYVAKYIGKVNLNKWESGKPSTWDHPVDTRQCHWTIESYVERESCLASKTGETFCKGELNRMFGTSFTNKGSDFVVTGLRRENCGNAESRYQSDVSNAKNTVNDLLGRILEEDTASYISDLKTHVGGSEVLMQ